MQKFYVARAGDNSFFYASLCPKDENFKRAGHILEEAVSQGTGLWATGMSSVKQNLSFNLGR